MPGRTVVVIPCFDEAERLDPDQVFALTAAGLDVLLVDDGSSDGTVDVIKAAAARSSGRIET
ncbi:MAG: glycosyltransferase, partial [Ilumatobacter sp.]|nr:glycosyltransferase [Ilumatobacter sp.]